MAAMAASNGDIMVAVKEEAKEIDQTKSRCNNWTAQSNNLSLSLIAADLFFIFLSTFKSISASAGHTIIKSPLTAMCVYNREVEVDQEERLDPSGKTTWSFDLNIHLCHCYSYIFDYED